MRNGFLGSIWRRDSDPPPPDDPDVRTGRIESSDGTKLAYVLAQLGKLIESGEIEKRLEALEGVLVTRKVRP